MTNGEKNNGKSISQVDAIKLVHKLDDSIMYRGFNAQQIYEMKQFTQEDRDRIRKEYSNFWRIKTWQLYICLVLLFILATLVSRQSSIFVYIGLLIFYIAYVVAKREGRIRGYEDGFEGGINKVLGLSDEEATDIEKRVREREVWDAVLNHIDANKSDVGNESKVNKISNE